MQFSSIFFEDEDKTPAKISNIACQIGKFVIKDRLYLLPIIDLTKKISGWKNDNYKEDLEEWKEMYGSINTVNFDMKKIDQFVDSIYAVVNNDNELNKLRGCIAEEIVAELFYLRNDAHQRFIHKGCAVNIEGKKVYYNCDRLPKTQGQCGVNLATDFCKGSRETVDLGLWNFSHAEFVEVKLSPKRFQFLEGQYLLKLEEKLIENEIDHAIYIIAMEDTEMTRRRIRKYFPNGKVVYVLGVDKLLDFEKNKNFPTKIYKVS